MSAQPSRQTIRLRCDETSRTAVLDKFTNGTPTVYARAATDFQVEFVSGGVLDDVSNLSSVTLETAPYSNRDAARKMSKTLAGSALDNTLDDTTWANGTKQHAVFSFSSAEMHIDLGGATSQDLWLVISAITSAGDPIVYATGKLIVTDPGTFNSAPPPPDNLGVGITIDQADLRYARSGAGGDFAPAITSVGDNATGSLEHVATVALAVPALRSLLIGNVPQDWYLLAGTDANDALHQRPNDYDASTNARVWVRLR